MPTVGRNTAVMIPEERLARLEVAVEQTQKSIEVMANAVTSLTAQMAEVMAELRNPSREHCVMTPDIDRLDAEDKVLNSRVTALEADTNRAKGALSFAVWLLGFLGVSNIGLIIFIIANGVKPLH